MAALVLKWMETNRGRVRTCASAVKMAELNYYSFKFQFFKVFSFPFLCCMSNTTEYFAFYPCTFAFLF